MQTVFERKAASAVPQAGSLRIPALVIVGLVLGCSFLALITWPVPFPNDTRLSSDEQAMEFFQDHATGFEELRGLLEQCETLFFYHLGRDEATPSDAFSGASEVKERVVSLMRSLKLEMVNGPASGWGIRMPYETRGMAMAGTAKSFFFSRRPPAKIVPKIDAFKIDSPEGAVWRPMAPNWYLQLDWGG